MRIKELFALGLAALLVQAPALAAPYEEGLSPDELKTLAAGLPKLTGRIEAMLIFRGNGRPKNSVAIATWGEHSVWQIYVFSDGGRPGYTEDWKSGDLGDSFAVSSSRELRLINLGDEDAVEFEGCAPHVCPDVFSILLYVPSKRDSYIVNYVQGKTSYSASVVTPGNEDYKRILDNLVKQHLQEM